MGVVRLKFSGTVFTERANTIVKQAATKAGQEVAQAALAEIRSETRVFKAPTGRYKASLNITSTADSHRISDRHTVQGKVLENGRRRSSFRGYQLWAKATKSTERQADIIMDQHMGRAVRQLNG